jgi:hypothetical protein
MKLQNLKLALTESTTEDETPSKAPAPKGALCTGAQAAKILGCSMSRIRQYKADGTLVAAKEPEPGSRDTFYKLSAVEALKGKQVGGELERTGRPVGAKEGSGKED